MSIHKTLANWYYQLAQQLEAGIALSDALILCEGPPLKGRLQLQSSLTAGNTIEATFNNAPKWLPSADRIFIAAATTTGRLPQTLANLSIRHQRISEIRAKVATSLIYPLGVLHVAALLLPLMQLIDPETGFAWDTGLYLKLSGGLLLPLWSFIAVMIFLAKSQHPLLPRILRGIPFLRKYSRLQAIADFSSSLGTFIETGLPIQSAWLHAVQIASDPKITIAYQKLGPIFAAGKDPADALKGHSVFPPDLVAYYQTGARSGQLDRTLLKAGEQFQSKATKALGTAAVVYPTLLLIIVAAIIIYSIFQIYGGYLTNFDDILNL